MEYKRGKGSCHHCNTWFGGNNLNKLYCNVNCRNTAYRDRQLKQKPLVNYSFVCIECTERFDCTGRQAAQRPSYCGATCRKRASRRAKAEASGNLYTPSIAEQKRAEKFAHLENDK